MGTGVSEFGPHVMLGFYVIVEESAALHFQLDKLDKSDRPLKDREADVEAIWDPLAAAVRVTVQEQMLRVQAHMEKAHPEVVFRWEAEE